ncbi:MAG: flavin reductase [Chloroflexi bacterium]|nr:flavin reductase [Chloroflexota bacterium]
MRELSDPHGALTSDQFRQVMGLFATGVTILTSAHGSTVRAMTANAVASVSLDPLSLLVCVNRSAIMHDVLSRGGGFCVNFLKASQEHLARACARPDSAEASLSGVEYQLGKNGAPILTEAMGYVECAVATALDFGTHTIFVGTVLAFGGSEGDPLLFFGGKYAGLGQPG